MMSNVGLIIEYMDLSHIHLAVCCTYNILDFLGFLTRLFCNQCFIEEITDLHKL